MSKKLKFLVTMLLGILLSINYAWGDTYTKVTSNTIDTNAEYFIGTSESDFLGATSGTWGSIVDASSAYVFTLSGTSSSFTASCSAGKLAVASSTGNWSGYTITGGAMKLANDGAILNNAGTLKLRKNGTSGFRWYSGTTGTQAYLYKINRATPATITLSEVGVETIVSGTHYVGDSYKIPDSEASCGDKVFVGWSTVQIPTGGDKPTSNYYAKGSSVTLGATNTFYAVFATESAGGAESTWSITPSNLDKPGSGSGYTPYNGSHTLDDYSYTTNQVMVQSSMVQFQTTNGYIYNTTSFGNITKIVVTGTNALSVFDCATSTTSKPSSGAISATGSDPYTFTFSGNNGFFFINANGSTPKASEIKVYYGGSTYTDD